MVNVKLEMANEKSRFRIGSLKSGGRWFVIYLLCYNPIMEESNGKIELEVSVSEKLVETLYDYIGEEHAEFLTEELQSEDPMDFEDALGYVYGALLEQGYDPEEILTEYGFIE
jgi:hypothetical protein